MVKKDKLQDSICCISIASLIGGVAEAALGQWWLLVIAIILIVISLWWMLTASRSIEAEAGSCPIILNGPLEWIDTHYKENAIVPISKGYVIKPSDMTPESKWAQYVEEAKEIVKGRIAHSDEEQLDSFTVDDIITKINELMQKDVGHYMKVELARERHRVDLENPEVGTSEEEHPYKQAILYSPISFKDVFSDRPSSITVDNYPGEEGIDVRIKTYEVAMIGMPMIQSTVPFIVVLPLLSVLEEIIERLIKADELTVEEG